ncbi:MAG: acetylornithine deacetylase [Planctomycetes bacterium]|nr:acetylornithine deacetylase [Planctomycetota bacterium]
MAEVLCDKDLLSRLVAFDSTSTKSNLPIADFVCEYLDRPNVAITRNLSEDGSKVNVVVATGVDGAGDDSGGLVLCGHLDVVPAAEEGWNSDPFTLTELDETYVGRGACDMKGSVALAMNVFARVDVDRLTHPLVLLFTYDEELGSLGAQRFADTRPSDQPLPPNVLVGEPTSLRAVRMHKGHLTMRITVRGKAAHSGSPHLGVNAIEAAAAVVRSLSKLAEQFKQQRIDSGRFFREVPFPVLNVAQISGGTAINIVPDRCVVDLGIRPLPGMNPQAMIEWIKDTVAKSDPHGNINIEVLNVNPPMLLEETAPIYAALSGLLSQTQSYAVSYASDAGVLQTMGLQCVLFGPGSIEVAHRPNEYVPIDEFNRARSIIEQLVSRFCMP